jgi:hypothetical protein
LKKELVVQSVLGGWLVVWPRESVGKFRVGDRVGHDGGRGDREKVTDERRKIADKNGHFPRLVPQVLED